MRTSSVLLAVVVLTSVVSIFCIMFYPSKQDFMSSNAMWNGITGFSREFEADSIDSLDALPDMPAKAVLVTIPYLEYDDDELARLKRFIDDGGTLLLMDDYGYGNSVMTFLGVGARFTDKPLLDPLFCYKNQAMPLITDFAPDVKRSDISVIMLNHATTLTGVAGAEAIAWSSGASFLDTNENGSREQDEPEGPFVVSAKIQLGRGTLALVSDPSILINAVVGRDDNYDFVRYLSRHKGEQMVILVDRTHLIQTPLDVAKARLVNTREALLNPYALLGITAMVFIIASGYTLKKGESSG